MQEVLARDPSLLEIATRIYIAELHRGGLRHEVSEVEAVDRAARLVQAAKVRECVFEGTTYQVSIDNLGYYYAEGTAVDDDEGGTLGFGRSAEEAVRDAAQGARPCEVRRLRVVPRGEGGGDNDAA